MCFAALLRPMSYYEQLYAKELRALKDQNSSIQTNKSETEICNSNKEDDITNINSSIAVSHTDLSKVLWEFWKHSVFGNYGIVFPYKMIVSPSKLFSFEDRITPKIVFIKEEISVTWVRSEFITYSGKAVSFPFTRMLWTAPRSWGLDISCGSAVYSHARQTELMGSSGGMVTLIQCLQSLPGIWQHAASPWM